MLWAAVGWTIIAVRSAKPARRGLSRLGWAQFWLVMSNGVVGGITVLADLNPYTVAGHFLAAMALLTVAALTWMRVREGDTPPRPLVGKPVKKLAAVLVVSSGLLVAAGTIVTGAGPHAGDSSEVPRMPIEVKLAAQTHAAFAWIVIVLTLALWFVLRAVDALSGPGGSPAPSCSSCSLRASSATSSTSRTCRRSSSRCICWARRRCGSARCACCCRCASAGCRPGRLRPLEARPPNSRKPAAAG